MERFGADERCGLQADMPIPLDMARPLGPSIAPLFLRIALGVTFVWAGIGKLEAMMQVKGENAALLATMGVERIRDLAPPGKTKRPIAPSEVVDPSQPTLNGLEVPSGQTAPPTNPANGTTPAPMGPTGPTQPTLAPTEVMPQAQPQPQAQPRPANQPVTPPATDIAPTPAPVNPTPEPGPPQPPQHVQASWIMPTLAQVTAPSISPGAGQPNPNRVYQAAEFPDVIEVPRVYGLALLIHRAAFPPVATDQPKANAMMKLWPERLSRGMWPVRLAWMVAVTEVVAGLFVLVGLMTRASAIMLAGTMLGAIWLTEIGPAMQAGTTVLGILPDRDPFSIDAWRALMWQLALLMSAAALTMLGSGALGFDRKLFPPPPPAPPTPRLMM